METTTNITQLLQDEAQLVDFISGSFNFWFHGLEHIRTPFPEYLREASATEADKNFREWLKDVPAEARNMMTEDFIADKLEEFLFSAALPLVKTEDEKLSLMYPFMPRVGDTVNDADKTGIVEKRAIEKKGDESFLKVWYRRAYGEEMLEAEFELPA